MKVLRAEHGDASGVIVSGDIAFGGHKEEYEIALKWLNEVCAKVGCQNSNVWCVPGNHDIDRAVIDGSKSVRNARQVLRQSSDSDFEEQLAESMRDAETASMLLRPLEAYNSFAGKFRCGTTNVDPAWKQDLQLNDTSVLRLVGANSVLVSDRNDIARTGCKLILGSRQATTKEEQGVTNVFICHHPPDWLYDADRVNTSLDARARVQLFGHKHAQVLDVRNNCLRLVAGAVQPNRREQGWKPRYNWLRLSVEGGPKERKLRVQLSPRIWSDQRLKFMADTELCDRMTESRSVSLDLPDWQQPDHHAMAGGSGTARIPASLTATAPEARPPDLAEETRQLTYRFLTLPFVTRVRVAERLELLKNEDEGIADVELFERVFERAAQGQRLMALWNEVEKAHGRTPVIGNPYNRK